MGAATRNKFPQHFAALLEDSGLQAKQVALRVNASRPKGASWSVTAGLLSAWKTGRNLPSEANQDGFFRVVRLLTEHARGRALRGHAVGELLDEVAWTRMLKRARAIPLPDAAQHSEVERYLKTVIEWMNSDPWPRDRRFGGPVLTPAVIERKLRATTVGKASEQELGADELVDQCQRLVVLGGPGSGKTWLAKRTVRRSAEAALEALTAGVSLDGFELPLYTTCSRLVVAEGDIRQAVVSSALDQFGDLGGSRPSAALRSFFTERNAPTLLVIDSLDEAHGSEDRLRQADTLPWRIVLTSRPSSWNQQLDIKKDNDAHLVGALLPLRYPDDVEPFIHYWFRDRPEQANDLVAQIARRPGLQQAATVPLILAFYCILGGSKPLPYYRRDLYSRVLNRVLTGRWRGSDDSRPDVSACLQVLRAWAWSGTDNHPVSGVGAWADHVLVDSPGLSAVEEDALDHVAVPLGPPDVDTGKTMRRFIHRSIREHLVAEHVAGLPVRQAVEELLPHLWYDPDWEYAAPTALAMHQQHDQLLRDLIAQAAGTEQFLRNVSVIDTGWELQGLFARLASESADADWSAEAAHLIGQARVKVARAGGISDLLGAVSWEASTTEACEALLDLVPRESTSRAVGTLRMNWVLQQTITGMAQLAITTDYKRHARAVLLERLAGQSDVWEPDRTAEHLLNGVIQLAVTGEDKCHSRKVLLALLARRSNLLAALIGGGIAQLGPTEDDRRCAHEAILKVLNGYTGGATSGSGCGMNWLTPEDRNPTAALRAYLASSEYYDRVAKALVDRVVQLAVKDTEKKHICESLLRLLEQQGQSLVAAALADGIVQLSPTWQIASSARDVLLGLLSGQMESFEATALIRTIVRLTATARAKSYTRDAVVALLATHSDGRVAAELANTLCQLDPTAEDKRQALDTLLPLLAGQTEKYPAAFLASMIVQLDPTAEDKRQALDTLLTLLADRTTFGTEHLMRGIVELTVTTQDKRKVRAVLLGMLGSQTYRSVAEVAESVNAELDSRELRYARAKEKNDKREFAHHLLNGLTWLAAKEEDKRQLREYLLRLLSDRTNRLLPEISMWRAVARLSLTAEERHQIFDTLLRLLATESDEDAASSLAIIMAGLNPTQNDKCKARRTLLDLLGRSANGWACNSLVVSLVKLDPTAEEKGWTLDALLRLLAEKSNYVAVTSLVDSVLSLDPAPKDKSQVKNALLKLLTEQTSGYAVRSLAEAVGKLDLTPNDKNQIREALLKLLAEQTSGSATQGSAEQVESTPEDEEMRDIHLAIAEQEANRLMDTLAQFDPIARELSTCRTWAFPPTINLLTEARRNSSLHDWLAALPSLPADLPKYRSDWATRTQIWPGQ